MQVILNNVLFVISVALQMAAAIMLLLGTISRKQVEQYIKRKNRGPILVGPKEEADKIIEEKRIEENQQNNEQYRIMYMNRFAAGYLFCGYLIGIWGENNADYKMQETLMAILLFIIFMIIAIGISCKCASSPKNENTEGTGSICFEVLETEDIEK